VSCAFSLRRFTALEECVEKASAYFKHKGFENVYQPEGGIIEYTRQVKEEGLKSNSLVKTCI
jgi:UPF0176 protein